MSTAYDPIKARATPSGQGHIDSMWAATAGPQPDDDGQIEGDRDCDVVIIGAGFTGLSCAYHLAQGMGEKAIVLEANLPGWGASGRNGGISRPMIGRVPLGKRIAKWGEKAAITHFSEQLKVYNYFRDFISEKNIDCDVQNGGGLRIAHRHDKVKELLSEQRLLKSTFGYETEFLSEEDLRAQHFVGGEAYGALRFPDAFGLHPMKLVFGLVRLARASGVSIYRHSPVVSWHKEGDLHVLRTPQARVRAKRVVIATNGYTGEFLHPAMKATTLPVISNIAVTHQLTAGEIDSLGFKSHVVMSDTRTVLHYYRRLPDNRILIGGRGPIDERPETLSAWSDKLQSVLKRKFPNLKRSAFEYSWHGWTCLTYDAMPHVHSKSTDPSVLYGMGYCGSGTACSVYAGRLLAGKLSGEEVKQSAFERPLPRFPFPAFRRLGQRAMFQWYRIVDG